MAPALNVSACLVFASALSSSLTVAQAAPASPGKFEAWAGEFVVRSAHHVAASETLGHDASYLRNNSEYHNDGLNSITIYTISPDGIVTCPDFRGSGQLELNTKGQARLSGAWLSGEVFLEFLTLVLESENDISLRIEHQHEVRTGLKLGSSCWSGLFTQEKCCDPLWSPRGNEECWSDTFTYASCCLEQKDHSGYRYLPLLVGKSPAEVAINRLARQAGPSTECRRQVSDDWVQPHWVTSGALCLHHCQGSFALTQPTGFLRQKALCLCPAAHISQVDAAPPALECLECGGNFEDGMLCGGEGVIAVYVYVLAAENIGSLLNAGAPLLGSHRLYTDWMLDTVAAFVDQILDAGVRVNAEPLWPLSGTLLSTLRAGRLFPRFSGGFIEETDHDIDFFISAPTRLEAAMKRHRLAAALHQQGWEVLQRPFKSPLDDWLEVRSPPLGPTDSHRFHLDLFIMFPNGDPQLRENLPETVRQAATKFSRCRIGTKSLQCPANAVDLLIEWGPKHYGCLLRPLCCEGTASVIKGNWHTRRQHIFTKRDILLIIARSWELCRDGYRSLADLSSVHINTLCGDWLRSYGIEPETVVDTFAGCEHGGTPPHLIQPLYGVFPAKTLIAAPGL